MGLAAKKALVSLVLDEETTTEATDSNFKDVILLVKGDGSEGQGDTSDLGDPSYKAFEDNSSNSYDVTVSGDAYGNDFSPYYYADGYWSVLFDGTDDILSVPNSSNHEFGTGQFTVELWVYMLDKSAGSGQGFLGNYGSASNGWAVQLYGDNLEFAVKNGQIAQYDWSSRENNRWYHLAFARDGSNNMRAFIDGTQVVTGVKTDDITIGSNALQIGNLGPSLTRRFKGGYISNVRIVKGTALYTSTFTKPTAPLTTTSQGATASEVELLMCQSNRFVDNSSNSFAVTLASQPKISTNTPFTQSKTDNVGSGYFDGNGDVIYVEETDSNFTYGTGDYEFSCWVYRTVTGAQQTLFGRDSTGNTNVPYIYITSGDKFAVYYGSVIAASTINVPSNAWCHLVASRVSGVLKLFQDGVQVASVSNTTDLIASTKIAIGNQHTGGTTNAFTGFIADARVRKGSGVTSVTVPTTSLTAETGTELLTCQYSGAVRTVGFVDDSKYNHRVLRNGDSVLGTFTPFSGEDGYWTTYSDGAGFMNSGFTLTDTGSYTYEGWVMPTVDNSGYAAIFATVSNFSSFPGVGLYASNSSPPKLHVRHGGTTQETSDGELTYQSWHFVRVVFDSSAGTLKTYLDGTEIYSSTSISSNSQGGNACLFYQPASGNQYFHGYISNFRFRPVVESSPTSVPSAPFDKTDANTEFLFQSNRFENNGSKTGTVAITSTVKIFPYSPFAPNRSYSKDNVGGSVYFDGSGDDLTIFKSSKQFMLTTNWTIELWVYITETGNISFMDHRGSNGSWGNQSSNGLNFQFYCTSSTLYWQVSNTTYLSGSFYPKPYSWNHFAVSNDGTQTSVFQNGTRILNGTTNFTTLPAGSDIDRFTLGRNPSGYDTHGYFSGVKIHNTEYYDASATTITVPTQPPVLDANTYMLLNFTNAGIIDHSMKNNLLTAGDTRLTTADKKIGTGSLFFDGSGNDYLQAVNTESRELFTPGTGDMTWECFVKFDTNNGGLQSLFGKYGSGSEYFFYYDWGNTDWRLVYHASTFTWDDNSVSTGTWYHIAVVKSGTTHYVFKDGTSLGTQTATYNTTQSGRNFALGATFGGGNSLLHQLVGKIDEFRVTRAARYTSNFTAPTQTFPTK